ncbi:MAG: hypothetical protein J5895_01590 [Alphaproteobacteria bacterium]|nr:hypothetical protein [Alphaproteobacteria bacterium]
MEKSCLKSKIQIGSLAFGLSIAFLSASASAQLFSVDDSASQNQRLAPTNLVSQKARQDNIEARGEVKENVRIEPVKQSTRADLAGNMQEIRLALRDFKISKNLNGSITCDMKFYVYSTMKENISNISYRLKWPDMETPLSFDNVAPAKAQFRKYALLGKGCYNMDKIPNIIVNRCRIKGMSQQDCANAIRWVK